MRLEESERTELGGIQRVNRGQDELPRLRRLTVALGEVEWAGLEGLTAVKLNKGERANTALGERRAATIAVRSECSVAARATHRCALAALVLAAVFRAGEVVLGRVVGTAVVRVIKVVHVRARRVVLLRNVRGRERRLRKHDQLARLEKQKIKRTSSRVPRFE